MQFNFKLKYLAIIISIITGYFFLYYFSSSLEDSHSVCLFKNITGIPCPSCGTTRASIKLLHGEFLNSILLNPLGLLVSITLFVSIVWMSIDIYKNKETFLPFIKKDFVNKYVIIFAIILTLANWIWNIEKGL